MNLINFNNLFHQIFMPQDHLGTIYLVNSVMFDISKQFYTRLSTHPLFIFSINLFFGSKYTLVNTKAFGAQYVLTFVTKRQLVIQ